MWLDEALFRAVIANAPLISIDLLVQDSESGEYLLGLRRNSPAKDFWFVPGGRILKNESINTAFQRIANTELAVEVVMGSAEFVGVYEHFYQDSVFDENISTHYVVLAYRVSLQKADFVPPEHQHSSYVWKSQDWIITNESVHKHSRDYFNR